MMGGAPGQMMLPRGQHPPQMGGMPPSQPPQWAPHGAGGPPQPGQHPASMAGGAPPSDLPEGLQAKLGKMTTAEIHQKVMAMLGGPPKPPSPPPGIAREDIIPSLTLLEPPAPPPEAQQQQQKAQEIPAAQFTLPPKTPYLPPSAREALAQALGTSPRVLTPTTSNEPLSTVDVDKMKDQHIMEHQMPLEMREEPKRHAGFKITTSRPLLKGGVKLRGAHMDCQTPSRSTNSGFQEEAVDFIPTDNCIDLEDDSSSSDSSDSDIDAETEGGFPKLSQKKTPSPKTKSKKADKKRKSSPSKVASPKPSPTVSSSSDSSDDDDIISAVTIAAKKSTTEINDSDSDTPVIIDTPAKTPAKPPQMPTDFKTPTSAAKPSTPQANNFETPPAMGSEFNASFYTPDPKTPNTSVTTISPDTSFNADTSTPAAAAVETTTTDPPRPTPRFGEVPVVLPKEPEKPKEPTPPPVNKKLTISGYMTSPAASPARRDNKRDWYQLHEKFVKMCEQSNAEVCLVGDSLVNGLARYPRVWNKYFKPFQALNFGIGGDRTEHVLWRVENGEVPKKIKYAVIHCGTNNIDKNRPQDIANGIISIGLTFQDTRPGTRVIIHGLLPRDLDAKSHRRQKIRELNSMLKLMCEREDMPLFLYAEPDSGFLQENGQLNEGMYYHDCLHLVEPGDDKLANTIYQAIIKLQKEVKEAEVLELAKKQAAAQLTRVRGEAPIDKKRKRTHSSEREEREWKRKKEEKERRSSQRSSRTPEKERSRDRSASRTRQNEVTLSRGGEQASSRPAPTPAQSRELQRLIQSIEQNMAQLERDTTMSDFDKDLARHFLLQKKKTLLEKGNGEYRKPKDGEEPPAQPASVSSSKPTSYEEARQQSQSSARGRSRSPPRGSSEYSSSTQFSDNKHSSEKMKNMLGSFQKSKQTYSTVNRNQQQNNYGSDRSRKPYY